MGVGVPRFRGPEVLRPHKVDQPAPGLRSAADRAAGAYVEVTHAFERSTHVLAPRGPQSERPAVDEGPGLRLERPSLERFVDDLGRKAFESACWRGAGLVADSIAPGVGGRVVEGLRFASKVAGAFDSLADGRGIAVAVPVAVDARTGFSLEVEATVGRHAQVRLDVGLDPWAPPNPGEPSVSGVPAANELALDELVRVNQSGRAQRWDRAGQRQGRRRRARTAGPWP